MVSSSPDKPRLRVPEDSEENSLTKNLEKGSEGPAHKCLEIRKRTISGMSTHRANVGLTLCVPLFWDDSFAQLFERVAHLSGEASAVRLCVTAFAGGGRMRETWELLPLLHRMSLSRKKQQYHLRATPTPIQGPNFKQDSLGNHSTPNVIRTVHILRCEGGFHPIIFHANAEGEASGASCRVLSEVT